MHVFRIFDVTDNVENFLGTKQDQPTLLPLGWPSFRDQQAESPFPRLAVRFQPSRVKTAGLALLQSFPNDVVQKQCSPNPARTMIPNGRAE